MGTPLGFFLLIITLTMIGLLVVAVYSKWMKVSNMELVATHDQLDYL